MSTATATISSFLNVSPRYLRSTNLERDFGDRGALDNYVLTSHAYQCLDRLSKGIRPGSTQRAWRITGNYGSGKSSFALFLAHWFKGDAGKLSKTLGVDVQYNRFSIGTKPNYLPVLITGSREPIGRAIVRALADLLDEHYVRGAKSNLQVRLRTAQEQAQLSEELVLALLSETNDKLIRDEKGHGLLIVLDELGKFLEFAARNPEQQDVYLLQRLAEKANGSSKTAPLYVIGMLHQGFDAYAENLEPTAQREWEKVAGRFEELVFNQPLIQVSELIAAALRVNVQKLPSSSKQEARAGWSTAADLGWIGGGQWAKSVAADLAPKLYPLHATVLPAMVRTFARFGQNERSLFSFLLSEEPFGLMQHAEARAEAGAAYRLHHFYDYVRSSFGYRLSAQSYRSHWTQIESMVESFSTGDPIEHAVVKTVGIINLLDHPDLIANEAALEGALGGVGGYETSALRTAIDRLVKKRKVLFRRGSSAGFRLWPHTSVDLESAYEHAIGIIGPIARVGHHLRDFIEVRSLVARKHYIETGNLRFFGVRYLEPDELRSVASEQSDGDGTIVVVLCETQADIDQAEKTSKTNEFKLRPDLLIAIPGEPLSNQAGLVAELRRWQWVSLNTPELNSDRFAREEVGRQVEAARLRLENRVQDLVGLRSLSGTNALRWYFAGTIKAVPDGKALLRRLSTLCDDRYGEAPKVKNELLNRHTLSSAAARARLLLAEGLLERSQFPWLGMDSRKKPPEMSMYMSVLQRGNIHVPHGDKYRLQIPSKADDVLNLRPCLEALRAHLESKLDERIKATELLAVLQRKPYGVRDGLAWLLIAVFIAINSQELAFYEDGTFVREIGGDEYQRLTKVPSSFEVQLCRISGVRAEVFEFLMKILDLKASTDSEPMVLDIVRPLCQFVAGLPDYARNSKRMSKQTLAVREAILAAKDPVKLLFTELPEAIGLTALSHSDPIEPKRAKAYANALKESLEELRHSYSDLLERMVAALRDELSIRGELSQMREDLSRRANSILLSVSEPRLKALSLRFSDLSLADNAWLESLGSMLTSQPPGRWRDTEEDIYKREINLMALRFRDLESILFAKVAAKNSMAAYKVAVTMNDGREAHEVVFLDAASAAEVHSLTARLQALLSPAGGAPVNRDIRLAALSQLTWGLLASTSG